MSWVADHKCQQPEKCQGDLEKERRRNCQGNAGKAEGKNKLGDDNPPSLVLSRSTSGLQIGLITHGQIKEAGIQRDVGIGDAHPLVHDH
jgi:hypothetical protein